MTAEQFLSASSIFDITVKDLHDNDFQLSMFNNNQVLLIVNFATNDELADKNFLDLKDLKQRYGDGKHISLQKKVDMTTSSILRYFNHAVSMLPIW